MRWHNRRALAITLVAAGVILLAWLGFVSQRASSVDHARGVLIDVQILDIGHARSFILRSSDGREHTFEVDPSMDMTPGHMREHMAFGEPVTVTYRRDGTRLIATQVTD